ncbi:MAG: hypothetical protein ACLTG0_17355 [Oscillibacter sp.]
MSKIQCWCRANAMLVISLLAAVVTAFFVPPDRDYLGYYDLKTLACLFCVLAVVGALRDLHIFPLFSQRMVHTFFHCPGRVYGAGGYHHVRLYAPDQ